MKTKAISSIFVLFAIAAGMASMAPDAYAHPDHDEISITALDESKLFAIYRTYRNSKLNLQRDCKSWIDTNYFHIIIYGECRI